MEKQDWRTMENLENRKKDHIRLALKSQTPIPETDPRFHYEPMLAPHPNGNLRPIRILGKELRAPLWVSSMTGGTPLAGDINRNLARACREFGLGMGLGSCRIILEDDRYLDGFDVRATIGDDLPLWANLGIAQIESLVDRNEVAKAEDLVRRLRADGLIIHVNPMQEFFQPEGDILRHAPIETIRRFLERFQYPVIVKEVGQGMGPKSMRALLDLPIQAIEFAAFGGTNFARLELMRDETGQSSVFAPLAAIGENAFDMLDQLNAIAAEGETACKEVIISGGIRSFLDGYYVISKSSLPAIYGMASGFLKHAWGPYEELQRFVREQVQGLAMAQAYLTLRN